MKFPLIETVQLSSDVEPIEEWIWIDYVPQMQYSESGKQIHFSGVIQFRGGYRSTNQQMKDWEHHMPVELYIPANRILNPLLVQLRAEGLSVERKQPRELTIRAELWMDGLQPLQESVEAANVTEEIELLPERVVLTEEIEYLPERVVKSTIGDIVEHDQGSPPIDSKMHLVEEFDAYVPALNHWSDWLVKRSVAQEDHSDRYTMRMIIVREDVDLQVWAEQLGLSVRSITHLNGLVDAQLRAGQSIRAI